MKYPQVYNLNDLLYQANDTQIESKSGKWIPARGSGFPSIRNRFRLAWMVFTGKGDVLMWPEQ